MPRGSTSCVHLHMTIDIFVNSTKLCKKVSSYKIWRYSWATHRGNTWKYLKTVTLIFTNEKDKYQLKNYLESIGSCDTAFLTRHVTKLRDSRAWVGNSVGHSHLCLARYIFRCLLEEEKLNSPDCCWSQWKFPEISMIFPDLLNSLRIPS